MANHAQPIETDPCPDCHKYWLELQGNALRCGNCLWVHYLTPEQETGLRAVLVGAGEGILPPLVRQHIKATKE